MTAAATMQTDMPAPSAFTDAALVTMLRQKLGPQAEAKIAAARGMIAKAAERWPGVYDHLDRSGLTASVHLVEQLAARAARRPNR